MNLEKPEKIEEFVLKVLAYGPMPAMVLVKKISSLRLRATKQAVYSVIRKLKKAEIVVVHGQIVSLNNLWIKKMSDFFAEARHKYSIGTAETEGFLALADGDKITYNFKNPNIADAFWGHAFDLLADVMPATEPIYIYDPHEWFLIAREEQEAAIFNRIIGTKRQILMTTPGNTELDKAVKKHFDGKYGQYYMSPVRLFKKPNYYVNIFGDFLIEAWIDEKTHIEIEKFYNNYKILDEEAKAALKKIINSQGKNKISISRNKEKAEKLKKTLGKEFYVIQSK